MIEIKNLSFSYKGKQVLKNFNLTVKDGEKICLFGESGIGKTTIVRLILRLEKKYSGEIVNASKPCVVFQEDRLLPFKTVFENISIFSDKPDDYIEYVLKELGILEFKDKYPSQLSGGISRRSAIARALCMEGDLFIFDEPFSALDAANTKKAINLINEITKDKSVILITHDSEDAKKMNCKIKKV